jgi:methyl-accepting chemotaxis protein
MLKFFKNLKFGTKLSIFAGIMVCSMLLMLLVGWMGSKDTREHQESFEYNARAIEDFKNIEIAHLRWVAAIDEALIQNKPEIRVEFESGRCGLGQFLSSEQAREMVRRTPALGSLFESIKAPHHRLHISAREMQSTWAAARIGFRAVILSRMTDLQSVGQRIAIALLEHDNDSAIGDQGAVEFIAWVKSADIMQARKEDLNLDRILKEIDPVCVDFHESLSQIQMASTRSEKTEIFLNRTLPSIDILVGKLKIVLEGENAVFSGQDKSKLVYENKLMPALEETQAILKQVDGILHNGMQEADRALKAGVDRANRLMLLTSAGAILFAVVLGALLIGMVTKPLLKCERFAERMASGDFCGRIELEQQDEMGRLAGSLNHMAKELQSGFSEIREGVGSMASATTELSAISTQLSGNAERSDQVSSTVAAATEQTSHNMASVAASVEQMSANLRSVASASEEMTSTIQEIARNTDRGRVMTKTAVGRVSTASGKMEELRKAAQMIGSITDTIKGISDQTNLLALNATIEAASAGEAGKGFAVVANEIKELSRQTAGATEQIRNSIEGIQKMTDVSLEEITGIVEVIEQIDEITTMIASAVEEQSNTTNEIASNVTQTAEGVQEVAMNVSQVNEAASEMARDVSQVRQSASEIASASTQLNASAGELAEFAERLNDITKRYQV